MGISAHYLNNNNNNDHDNNHNNNNDKRARVVPMRVLAWRER